MPLDLGTVLVTGFVTTIVCQIVTLVLLFENRHRYDGLLLWTLGFGMESLGILLLLLRGLVPDAISIVIANTLVVAGAMLVYAGFARFVGQRVPLAPNVLLLAAFAGVHAWFTFGQFDLPARNLNISIVLLLVFAQGARLMLWQVPPALRTLSRIPGLVFAAYCVVCTARIVHTLAASPEPDEFLRANAFDSAMYIALLALHVVDTFALVLMVNRRLVGSIASEEEKFSKAFNSSPHAVLLTRLSDGRIAEANEAFARVFGLARDEAIGRTALDLGLWMRPADRDIAMTTLRQTGRLRGAEFVFRRKSGEPLQGIVLADLIELDRQTHVLFSIDDVTEHRRVEAEQRAAEAAARQHQKLEAIGTLASGVAHEINNPLNVIMNYGQLILDGTGDVTEVKDYAGNIVKESERVSVIVRNLLAFSRPENEYRQPERPAEIVGRTTSLIRTILTKDRIILTTDVPGDLPVLACRPQQIQQILMNLVTNARDALADCSPPGGKTIRILGSAVDREGARWIRLTVEDNGCGIAPEVAGRVFDPFFSTKPRGKGTGLGLSISFGIAREHGGKLTFDSEVGMGTRFHLDLPVCPSPA